MTLTVISAELVQELLPMPDCIDLMEQAMRAASAREVSIPPRLNMPLVDGSGAFLLMPGSPADTGSYGAKLISFHPQNAERGAPVIQGFVCLFDHDSGAPVAIVEGASLTGIRTAAASGLATRLLAREEASSCGLFGTGVQAATHLDAMLAVRPVTQVRVWARDHDKAQAFAEREGQRAGIEVVAVSDPSEAGACDIVCTVTGSPEPVLQGAWVRDGAHINLVGGHSLQTRESDTALIARSRLYTDLMESCRNEGGDFMIPVTEGVITEAAIEGEIGQLLAQQISGRRSQADVTVYNSLGITAQDLYAAASVYSLAVERGLGQRVDL